MNTPSLARVIPAFDWLRAYDRSWLRTDIFAGITLAAYLLPAGLGDASLANLPPGLGFTAVSSADLSSGWFVVRGTQLSRSILRSHCSLVHPFVKSQEAIPRAF